MFDKTRNRFMANLFYKKTKIEAERSKRIKLCVWAYAYELRNTPVATDAQFDTLCNEIDLTIETGYLDDWWKEEFDKDTGMWIHTHPDLEGLERLIRYYE